MKHAAAALVALAGCDTLLGIHELETGAAIDAPVVDGATDALDGTVDDGLQLYLKLDDLGTDVTRCAADASGHGHDGACQGPLPGIVTGRVDNAFDFSGGGTVQVPAFPELASNAFTIAAWVSLDEPPLDSACLVNLPLGASNQDSWQICAKSNALFFGVGISSNTNPTPLAIGVFHHLALTSDGSIAITYLDGELIGTFSGTAAFDASPFVAGADLDSGLPIAPLNGRLDEIRFYDRTLSADEIAVLAR